MIRPLQIAIAFGLCLLVVLAALVWTTINLLRLDVSEHEALQQAALEENVRLALWRMDSALAGVVAQESVRPAIEYQPVYYRNPKGGGISLTPERGSAAVRSPLAMTSVLFVVDYLQIDADGRWTSPRLHNAENSSLRKETNGGTPDFRRQLDELAALVAAHQVADRLPPPATTSVDADTLLAVEGTTDPPAVGMNQSARGTQEFRRRAQYVQGNSVMTQNAMQVAGPAVTSSVLNGGVMTPVWLDGRLLLARRVLLGGQENLQICRLDWPAIESWLTGLVRDLLPEARLMPAPTEPDEQPSRRLAALPVMLVAGNLPAVAAVRWSPLGWSLVVAWVCVLLAALAVAVLLSGVVSLSERRAAFVAAVTHELRTPLTTFRVYAEMLAENMVPNEADRSAYLETLRSEAERLTHLVENVLSYARLERGRTVGAPETVSAGALIERVEDRLSARAKQADMQLVVEAGNEVRQETLHTDAASVEQILFNLVDNACKYAAGSGDRRIHLLVGVADRLVQLRVADHGPGVSPEAGRRLFQAFAKSAEDAARSAPGVGLGLALSRRLARQLGGRLDLETVAGYGACFVLSLCRRFK